MGFIKKIIYGAIALVFILMGGFSAQSNSFILQCGGVVGIIIGLVVLYVFGKMAWRAMGCIPSLLVLIIIVLFVLYAIGGFNGGIGSVGSNIQSFFGHGVDSSEETFVNTSIIQEDVDSESLEEIEIKESFEPLDSVEQDETDESEEQPASAEKNEEDKKEGVINLIGEDEHPIIMENFLPKPKKKQKKAFNPMDYPAIEGVSRVLTGDTLTIRGRVVKLFGIASPDISQTCADGQNRGYRCGQQSLSWLSSWLANNALRCHILSEDKRGVLTGVCMLGQYDIGAAIVNAGWAVADVRQTQIYMAYQNQASQNKRGLWQGKFYMPWDWQKIKARKANVKIIKPKSAKKKSAWSNLF